MLTFWNITTYGVSMPLISLLIRALLYNFDEDSGARWALYDDGMEMPSAGEQLAK
jgi:hypothetical protein